MDTENNHRNEARNEWLDCTPCNNGLTVSTVCSTSLWPWEFRTFLADRKESSSYLMSVVVSLGRVTSSLSRFTASSVSTLRTIPSDVVTSLSSEISFRYPIITRNTKPSWMWNAETNFVWPEDAWHFRKEPQSQSTIATSLQFLLP